MPPRNRFFTGRHALICELRDRLRLPRNENRPIAVISLQGMGGIGKTQTAVEFAYLHSGDYDIAWWVDADTSSLITDGLVGLANELSLTAESPQKTIEKLWAVLSGRENWLLIYDNVYDPTNLSDYRPPTNGHWILTSRNPTVARVADMIEISEFERSESLKLLELRVPWLPYAQAQRIAESLGDLPLAIEQASYFLMDTGLEVDDYLQLLTKHPSEAGLSDLTIDRHPGLVTAVSASINQLEATSSVALRVLKLISLLAPEPVLVMPERFDTDKDEASTFGIRFGDVVTTAKLVRELTTSGLVRRGGRALKMHRLIQLLVNSSMSNDERRLLEQEAGALLSGSKPGDDADPRDWPNFASLLPHVEALVSREPEIASWRDVQPFAELVIDCVSYFYRAGRYAVGLQLAATCLAQWRNALGSQHLCTLRMKNNLGMCLTGQKKYEEAAGLYRELLSEYTSLVGPVDPLTLRAANNVGVTLNGSGNHAEAVEILSQTLAGWNSTVGAENLETLRTASNLAEALIGTGEHITAAELAAKTLTVRRNLFGRKHPGVLITSCALGIALSRTDPERSRTILQDTLALQVEVLGPEHPNTIRTQDALNEIK